MTTPLDTAYKNVPKWDAVFKIDNHARSCRYILVVLVEDDSTNIAGYVLVQFRGWNFITILTTSHFTFHFWSFILIAKKKSSSLELLIYGLNERRILIVIGWAKGH